MKHAAKPLGHRTFVHICSCSLYWKLEQSYFSGPFLTNNLLGVTDFTLLDDVGIGFEDAIV